MNTSHGTSFYAIRDAFTGIRYDRVGHRVLRIPSVEGEGVTVAYYIAITPPRVRALALARD